MKPWYASKVVWFNVLLCVIGIADFVQSLINSGSLQWQNVALVIAGVAGVILRVWFTDMQIQRA